MGFFFTTLREGSVCNEKIGSFSLIERVILSAGAMLIFSVSFQIDQMPEGDLFTWREGSPSFIVFWAAGFCARQLGGQFQNGWHISALGLVSAEEVGWRVADPFGCLGPIIAWPW
jgi:hypothetical protein